VIANIALGLTLLAVLLVAKDRSLPLEWSPVRVQPYAQMLELGENVTNTTLTKLK
jgi:hypothetical protein